MTNLEEVVVAWESVSMVAVMRQSRSGENEHLIMPVAVLS